MTKQIDLSKLAEPFPQEDIEWRVSRAGMGKKGVGNTASGQIFSPFLELLVAGWCLDISWTCSGAAD